MTVRVSADLDGGWKDSLIALFAEFLAFFRRDIHADIDWARGYEPLNNELRKILPDAKTGRRSVDLLMRVWRLSGEERWVLIHIEVQAQRIANLPERIHHYRFLIYNQYRLPIASFVILADDDPSWRPGPYRYDLWGCRGEFEYPTVKLLDWVGREDELEASDNPFAIVVLAHLKARETAKNTGQRINWKVRLLKGLYGRKWTREQVRQLLRTIDWFLKLSQDDNRAVSQVIAADEQEKNMPYISTFEREGEARGLRNGIALALRLKFGKAGQQLADEMRDVTDLEALQRVTDSVEGASSLDEIRRVLDS